MYWTKNREARIKENEILRRVHIIDDDEQICVTLVAALEDENTEISYSLRLKEGIEDLFKNDFDVVILDVNFPDGSGLNAIEKIKEHPVEPEIIIMTGFGDSGGAALAMKSGVWDFIPKSSSLDEFKFSLQRALKYRKQKQPDAKKAVFDNRGIIGQSRGIKRCVDTAAKASKNDATVLLLGETGTGKEVFAKAIHRNSPRKEKNLIIVDCAALPGELVESVLFGHTKGAFTGADASTTGLIQMADGGTLFLDEVGELPYGLQKKFLRVLQEKKFRPIGRKQEVSSDFRLISATLRDLPEMVKKGEFRQDLYFRISSLKLDIPPLSERKSDIPLISGNYLEKRGCPQKTSRGFIDNLIQYDWPGNIRELINALEYACGEAQEGEILYPMHLPDDIRTAIIEKKLAYQDKTAEKCDYPYEPSVCRDSFKTFMDNMKKQYLQDLLAYCGGDIKAACQRSGLSKAHLYSLLKKYAIKKRV